MSEAVRELDPGSDPKRDLIGRAAAAFRGRFGAPPEAAAFAPGRVELLGNHTDYNGGFVMAVALAQGTAAAAGRGPPGDREAEVWSETVRSGTRFSLDAIARDPEIPWANYPKGVLRELIRAGIPIGGLRIAYASDLPVGSGVSSSAALEVATAEAAFTLFGSRPAERLEEALLCQRAEVEFAGVPCGLLDQFSSLFGAAGRALFLDCATLEHAALPAGVGLHVLLADTGVRHALADGQYAALRQSCERAAARLGELLGRPVRFLRDVTLDELRQFAGRLDPDDRRRAEHVIAENARVLEGRAALERGDLAALGILMVRSHASSRDLFGNSCPELDLLVEEAGRLPGFIGAKLCGGGFGGSTVNLVEAGQADGFARALAERFRARTGKAPRLLASEIGAGARGGAYR